MAHVIENTILIEEIDRLIKEKKTVVFTPTGYSMRPFIEGWHDTVTLAAKESVKRGDIALVRLTGNYVLHRVIAVEDNGEVTLMGDGNLCGQEHCRQEDVIAVVTEIRSPKGIRKPLTKGKLWYRLLPVRRWLLKIYRHSLLHLYHTNKTSL
ncbi:MAG: S24/S26 family peptidase [Paludibacteraceae bacterium]|nr:S24/S26 family peptidase [Paludibacteraceae bacterium]